MFHVKHILAQYRQKYQHFGHLRSLLACFCPNFDTNGELIPKILQQTRLKAQKHTQKKDSVVNALQRGITKQQNIT